MLYVQEIGIFPEEVHIIRICTYMFFIQNDHPGGFQSLGRLD